MTMFDEGFHSEAITFRPGRGLAVETIAVAAPGKAQTSRVSR